MGNNGTMASHQNFRCLTEQEFQETYGEVAIKHGDFDVEAAAKYQCCQAAGIMCLTVWGIVGLPVLACCYPAIKASVASRRVTLGESSLFYTADRYCCCGPCMCNCKHTENQVPLDKLQDLKLVQTWCGKLFNVWSLSAETAGQAGSDAGPELQLIGLKAHRAFKQECLAQVRANKAANAVVAPGVQHEPHNLSSQILLRIEAQLGQLQLKGACTPPTQV